MGKTAKGIRDTRESIAELMECGIIGKKDVEMAFSLSEGVYFKRPMVKAYDVHAFNGDDYAEMPDSFYDLKEARMHLRAMMVSGKADHGIIQHFKDVRDKAHYAVEYWEMENGKPVHEYERF